MYKAFTKTGLVICCVFKEKNWKNAINKADYYKHDFTPEIPEDLAGGISCHAWIDATAVQKRSIRVKFKGISMENGNTDDFINDPISSINNSRQRNDVF